MKQASSLFVPFVFSTAFLTVIIYIQWLGLLLFFHNVQSIALLATLTLVVCGVCAFWFRYACCDPKHASGANWIAGFFAFTYYTLGALNIFHYVYKTGSSDPVLGAVVALLFAAMVTLTAMLVFEILLRALCQMSGRNAKMGSATKPEKPKTKERRSLYGQAGYFAPKGKKDNPSSKAPQSSEQPGSSDASRSSDSAE